MQPKNFDINSCYKLPWTETNNPNGWIEPTTYCNLACPGCYRGLDKPDCERAHLPLTELKQQVDWFIENRNVHTISIAGGEPLMYPYIYELVTYISDKGLRTMLYTNGVLLKPEVAGKLEDAGLTQLVVHIDRFQVRPDIAVGETHAELRERVVKLMQPFSKVRLGFIQPLTAQCKEETDQLMQFLTHHIDRVNLMVFTLYRDICWNESVASNVGPVLSMDDAMTMFSQIHKFEPTAYLPKETNPAKPAWVFAQRAGIPDQILGSFSSRFYQFAHERYFKKNGKYLFISRQNSIKIASLISLINWKSTRKILWQYLKSDMSNMLKSKRNIYFQTFLIISPPEIIDNKRELCNGCPDRMLYNGKLVPSCILEELKTQSKSNKINATTFVS